MDCLATLLNSWSALSDPSILRWIVFHVFVIIMLAIDLGVCNRKAHVISIKEALTWSAVWIGLSLLFCALIYWEKGSTPALEWLTAYAVEKSLSIDNIFVFILIFTYFRIPAEEQHGVLFWGILGAIIMRATLIAFSVYIVHLFTWVMVLFGLFLIYSGIKLAFGKDKEMDPEQNFLLKWARKHLRFTSERHGHKFFIKENGAVWATPLFMTLLVIESSDVLFALDSIPAVIAISQDTFIVYTSNIMAILGLRALYFAVAGVMRSFRYLNVGLSMVLCFIGLKMCIETFDKYYQPGVANCHISIGMSLGIIATIIGGAIAASLLNPEKTEAEPPALTAETEAAEKPAETK